MELDAHGHGKGLLFVDDEVHFTHGDQPAAGDEDDGHQHQHDAGEHSHAERYLQHDRYLAPPARGLTTAACVRPCLTATSPRRP